MRRNHLRRPGDATRACNTDDQEERLGAVRSGTLPSPPFQSVIQLAFLVRFPCYVKVLTAGLRSLALHGAVRFYSFYSISRATRTTNTIIIVSFRKGSNNRFAARAGRTRERPGSERLASRASVPYS